MAHIITNENIEYNPWHGIILETPETRYQGKITMMQAIHAEISAKPKQKTWDDAVAISILENSPEHYGQDTKRFLVVGQPIACDAMPELDKANNCFIPRRKGTRSIGKNWNL